MYKFVKIRWKLEECTKSWKFKGKLCTLDVQIVQTWWEISFLEWTKSWKFNGKLSTLLDLQIVQICKKIEFIQSTNSWKLDGKSKNVPNHENSMETNVH